MMFHAEGFQIKYSKFGELGHTHNCQHSAAKYSRKTRTCSSQEKI